MENANVLARIAAEVGVGVHQVTAVDKLLAEGSTVPFIARYRKEAHGNLDEVQIGKIQDRVKYYTELEERKETILKSIDEQGKLTDELREFAEIRLENPEMSLRELGESVEPPLSRSGVNHRLKRLGEIAANLRNENKG